MIVKFKSTQYDEWIVFDEVDYLRYSNPKKDTPLLGDELNFADANCPAEEFQLWFMNKNQTAETIVRANSPIYLMNNSGKTIEIL